MLLAIPRQDADAMNIIVFNIAQPTMDLFN